MVPSEVPCAENGSRARAPRIRSWVKRLLVPLGALLAFVVPAGFDVGERRVATPVSLAFAQSIPIESRLSAGTTGLLRTVRQRFRQMRRVLANAAARWQMWLGGASVFIALSVVAPVIDRTLLGIWKTQGGRAFLRALSSAVVVYVRLLFDGRAPGIGKGLIAFAVVYGASSTDIMPDRAGLIWGFTDDIILIILASRSFMRMCPDELIEEHAVRVATIRARREELKRAAANRSRIPDSSN